MTEQSAQPTPQAEKPVTVLERTKIIYTVPFIATCLICCVLHFFNIAPDERILTWTVFIVGLCTAVIVFLDFGRDMIVVLLILIPLAVGLIVSNVDWQVFVAWWNWLSSRPAPFPGYFIAGLAIALTLMWIWDLIDAWWYHQWIIEPSRIRHSQPGGDDEVYMFESSRVGFKKPDILEKLIAGAETMVIRDAQGRVLKEVRNLAISGKKKAAIVAMMPQDSL